MRLKMGNSLKLAKKSVMKTKKCHKCGQELPVTEFSKRAASADELQTYCKSCRKEYARLHTLKLQSSTTNSGGVNYSDPELDGKTNREVMNIMVRCKRWLEARSYTIHLSGEYTEVKKLKF